MDAVMEMLVAIASSAGDPLFTDEEIKRMKEVCRERNSPGFGA